MENRHPFYYLSPYGLEDPNCESLAILLNCERTLLFEDGTTLIGNLRAETLSCPKDERLFVAEDATERAPTLEEIVEEWDNPQHTPKQKRFLKQIKRDKKKAKKAKK